LEVEAMSYLKLKKSLASMFLLVCCFIAVGTNLAFAKDNLSSTLTAYKVLSAPGGKEKLTPADKVKPGEVIEYQAVYRNEGKENLKNIQATIPIPAGTEYLPGTANPAAVYASLDGKKFELLPLKRKQTSADGKVTQVQVPYPEYRYLRWIVQQIDAGKDIALKVRVRIVQIPPAPAKANKTF